MELVDHHRNYTQSRVCSGCSAPIADNNRSGKCRGCYYGPQPTCSECGVLITRKSRTKKCGSCYRSTPHSRRNYSRGRICSVCGDPIVNGSTTGKCRACYDAWRIGPNSHGWKGGHLTDKGYRLICGHADHPNANGGGKILEHVWVMSEHLGRPLLKGETVHHKNGDRSDNHLSNLELWSTAQPAGQRVTDKVAYARKILALYGDDVDAGTIQ